MITQNIVHAIPVTDVIIKAVKTMATAQGFTNLKFKNRHGVIFHNADWIAGVDYDDLTMMKTKKMMMKIITMKPKTMKTRKNSKNKNRLTLMRLTISSQMQKSIPIQPYMRKEMSRNNHKNKTTRTQMSYPKEMRKSVKQQSPQEDQLEKPAQSRDWSQHLLASRICKRNK